MEKNFEIVGYEWISSQYNDEGRPDWVVKIPVYGYRKVLGYDFFAHYPWHFDLMSGKFVEDRKNGFIVSDKEMGASLSNITAKNPKDTLKILTDHVCANIDSFSKQYYAYLSRYSKPFSEYLKTFEVSIKKFDILKYKKYRLI